MESLVFVLLFTVVVMVWMREGSQAGMSVRQVCSQRVARGEEQVLTDVLWPAPCSQPVTIPDRGLGLCAFDVTDVLIRVEVDHSST